jgi:hypothetical protein
MVLSKPIHLVLLAMCMTLSASAEMPTSFTEATLDAGQKDLINAKNCNTGAILTQYYSELEHLKSDTQVSTMGPGADQTCQGYGLGGGLEASLNSNVIGKAHIAWQSVDPSICIHGRHPVTGRSIEDLTGVYCIEKFVQLWSGSRPGEISVDWLPCD